MQVRLSSSKRVQRALPAATVCIVVAFFYLVMRLRQNSPPPCPAITPCPTSAPCPATTHQAVVSAASRFVADEVDEEIKIKQCTPQQVVRQNLLRPVAGVGGCSGGDLPRIVHMIIPDAKVFVDIGTNKGFVSATYFELWAPYLGITPPILSAAHKKINFHVDMTTCGFCEDCNGVAKPILPRSRDKICELRKDLCREEESAADTDAFKVYSFDGSYIMVDGVKKSRDDLALKTSFPLEKMWTIELAAFTEIYTEGKTVDFVIADELGQITNGHAVRGGAVSSAPVLTVDEFMHRERLSHIDLLKIDTEGHDPFVLRGARQALEKQLVTVVTFEYHDKWPRTTESLKDTLKDVLKGYSCYHAGGNSLLIKLTDGCWSDELETRSFSNVWCASKKSVDGRLIARAFDRLSVAFG